MMLPKAQTSQIRNIVVVGFIPKLGLNFTLIVNRHNLFIEIVKFGYFLWFRFFVRFLSINSFLYGYPTGQFLLKKCLLFAPFHTN